MNKKVAYCVNIFPKLSETFIQREIAYLQKLDYDVQIFAIRRDKSILQSLRLENQQKNITYAFPDNISIGFLYNILYFFKNPIRFLKCIALILGCFSQYPVPDIFKQFILLFTAPLYLYKSKQMGIGHIHSHFSTAASIALFCRILNPKLKYGFTAHASADIYSTTILLKEKIQYSDYIIAISNYNKRYLNLISNYSFDNKIHVVHNGVEIRSRQEEYIKSKNKNRVNILSVGDFTYCKGYTTLIESLKILENDEHDLSLTIIGEGKQKEFFREFIERNHLTNEVKLVGSLSNAEVINHMYMCDIFVLASEIYINGKRDGIPTVCIEAMSTQTPVISTYISGIPELIINGKTGLLVPERNPEELSKAIEKLIMNPDLRFELAKNGYDFVKANFNIVDTIRSIDEVFVGSLHER
ncbi:MAG: glycosyltransferase family 4 protein [Bacteroidetes bacterium]|nr:glycosyltransferase family 4 protein [Bacteroidota bacterium]